MLAVYNVHVILQHVQESICN